MEGYRLFRKDRQGRQGGGIALCISVHPECLEVCLGMGEESTECLRMRIKGTGGIKVAVCYRPPDQDDQAEEALCGQEQHHAHKPTFA